MNQGHTWALLMSNYSNNSVSILSRDNTSRYLIVCQSTPVDI